MNIFENDYEIRENTIVTLGKFDGLHEGHRELIKITVEEAKKIGYKSLVYTFNQNPKNVLKEEKIISLISKEEKTNELKTMGVDYIVFQDFTYDFSRIEPEEFAKDIIKNKLHAKMVVVGFNYRFGKDAKGDADMLEALGESLGFKVKIIDPVKKDGKVISSSLMREELEYI